mgnify:CR=1 FL=1
MSISMNYDYDADCRQMAYDREQERLAGMSCENCQCCYGDYAPWAQSERALGLIYCENNEYITPILPANECPGGFLEMSE